jgi:hypothetical protein
MSARKCFLHVGTGKTGSSAIQYAFTKHQSALLKAGFSYPDAARNFDNVLAGKPTAGNALRINKLLHEENVAGALKLVEPYAKRPEHLVLSCEALWHYPPQVFDPFIEGVRSLGYTPEGLVFFRPQVEQIVSSYLQQVKADKARARVDLDKYVLQLGAVGSGRQMNWFVRAQELETAFGPSHLRVEWYPAVRRGGPTAVQAAAFDWLGAGSLYAPSESNFQQIVNPTPGREALLLLQRANAAGVGSKEFADEFLQKAHVAGIVGTKVTLGESASRHIMKATLDSNTRLLRQYCPNLDATQELASHRIGDVDVPLDQTILAKLRQIASEVLASKRRRLSSPQIEAVVGDSSPAIGSLAGTAVPERMYRPAASAEKKRRCIIHIGMHKTGTTSIQRSFNGFEDAQFVYADVGGQANHSLAFYSLFSETPGNHHIHQSTGRSPGAVRHYINKIQADLDKSIVRAGDRTLIVSGEDIGALSRQALETMKTYFAARFEQISIVGYVRPPAGWLTSSFQERVKVGRLTQLHAGTLYRNYTASLSKFDDIFGRDNVQLWKFDPKAFPEGCVVQDFCSRLRIEFSKSRIRRVNESLSREAVSLIYAYQKFGPTDEQRKMRGPQAMEFGKLIGGGKFRFSPELVQPILEANAIDIDWVETRLGQSVQDELGPHLPGDVRSEEDLLQFDRASIEKLAHIVGRDASSVSTPPEVASLVAAWQEGYSSTGRRPLSLRRVLSGLKRPHKIDAVRTRCIN